MSRKGAIKRDARYNMIKVLVDNSRIRSLEEIFIWVPKTVVASDLHIKVTALNCILANPASIVLEQLYEIGCLCGLSDEEIYLLYYRYYQKRMEERKSKVREVHGLLDIINKPNDGHREFF